MHSCVVSIQVGLPRTFVGREPWTSAILKQAAPGRRWLRREGLEGDGQADHRVHGGPDKAVLCYAAAHYPLWLAELPRTAPVCHATRVAGLEDLYGAFGENFTIVGASEAEVCLGDIYRAGAARVQVAQPRQPCRKLTRFWGVPDLEQRVRATGRSGWYLRVLEEGEVEPGLELILLDRAHREWTALQANQVMNDPHHASSAALAACPPLAESWKRQLNKRTKGTGE